jgi:TRAP-type mannitol/chloroaromatic compound transport system permease small subunit
MDGQNVNIKMKFAKKYIKFADAFSEKSGAYISWLTTVMVLVVCYDVVTRYFLKSSSVAIQELEWHLFAAIFLLGAAYTLKADRHVRVDVLYVKFSPKTRAWVNLLGCLIFLIPFCILIIISSKNFVINSIKVMETSPDPGGLPARFLLKAFIPLGFAMLLAQGISMLLKSLLVIRGVSLNNEETADA